MFFGPPASCGSSTPQKTLQSFVMALNRRDRRVMEALVHDSKSNPALDAEFQDEKEDGEITLLSVSNITIKPISQSRVNAIYLLGAVRPGGKPIKPIPEQVELVKIGRSWLIVAPKPDSKSEVGNLASIAMGLVNPSLLTLTKRVPKKEEAHANLKQIATGTLTYVMDFDDKFMLKPGDYHKSIGPYVKNKKVFRSPLDKPGTISFSFNGNLTGLKDDAIQDPKNTVMYFEGNPGTLKFRYDGKALVALADGSVRFVTPAEAKSLVWK